VSEVEKFFANDEERIAYFNGSAGYWWLRSPGIRAYDAARIKDDGFVGVGGSGVIDLSVGVRPALRLNLQ